MTATQGGIQIRQRGVKHTKLELQSLVKTARNFNYSLYSPMRSNLMDWHGSYPTFWHFLTFSETVFFRQKNVNKKDVRLWKYSPIYIAIEIMFPIFFLNCPIGKFMSCTQRNIWYYPKSINIVFNFSNKSFWCPNPQLVTEKITYMPICQFQLAISYFVDINTKTETMYNI